MKEFAEPIINKPVDDSLLLWLLGRGSRREGTLLADLSKKGHHGTLVNSPAWKNTPLGHNVLDFDGNNQYVEIPDHPDFTPGGNDLVVNGDFAHWTDDDPDDWRISGESDDDPEISEVDVGQGHGGTNVTGGYCNLYTSDGSTISMNIKATGGGVLNLVIGQRYRISIKIDTITAGFLQIFDYPVEHIPVTKLDTAKIYTFTFVATKTNPEFYVQNFAGPNLCDITIDYVSITPVKPFSISAWVNMHDATRFYIATKGVYNVDCEWQFRTHDDDKLHFRLCDESVDNCYLGRKYDTALTAYENQWLHFVATYNGGTSSNDIKIYLNGKQVDDSAASL
ncbi:unnamed protein product, partial [marine sediment metagenome]